MKSEDSESNPLELMLIDESAEPAALSLSLLKSITNNFSDDLQIGRGGFAVVYKGKLEKGTVAVKKLFLSQEVHETKFFQEVDSLMRVKHKNIVRFMGYCSDTQGKVCKFKGNNVMAEERQRFLCFEFLPQGSLDKHISDATHGLEFMERYRIIKGVCEGLHYLHHGDQKKIVHCDLKPANILLDHDMNPKITDFGLSRLFDDKQTRAMTKNVTGSMGYMAPEYMEGQITLKSDIYSLGIIILEILTGQKGYTKIENVLESWRTVAIEDRWLESVRVCAEIGIECIDSEPNNRPDTKSIIKRLTEMEHTYGFTLPQINAYDKVKLEIMGRVKWISLTKSAKDFPVLVRVRAPRKYTESSRLGLDLVAVLGISRSMTLLENRMDSMKDAMMFVIDNLGPGDRLSVVSFNDEMQRLTELSVMTDENRERVRRKVSMLVPRGCHNMGPALNEAAKILGQRGAEERSNRVGRIILLSDSKDCSFNLSDICPEFPVDTFGLGIEHEFDDLSQIAEVTKGLYSYVYHDLEKIKDALAQSLDGLMSVAAMDVQVSLQTLDGVYISSIESGSYPMQISSDNQSAIIQLSDLYAGEKKNFIVHLNVPVGEQNRLMNISGSYWNSKISKQAPIQLEECELAVLRSKRANPSDKSVHSQVAKELVRRRLWRQLNSMYMVHLNIEDLENSWNELKDSEDGENTPEPVVLALEEDLANIRRGGGESFMFLLSWLSSHSLQRATTKESPPKSSAFRVKAMEEMLRKADAKPKHLTESTGSDEKVKLEIMPRVNSISSTTGANKLPVLVRMTAPLRCTKSSRAGLDLVAVLHVGSSMFQENRLDFMKQTMMFVIGNLGRNDRLSVLSFNDKAQRLTELSFMTDANRERARREVCMLVPGGGANTGLALKEAAKILRHRALEELLMNRVGRVIFISDGALESPFKGQKMPREYVTVDTFGFGADHDPKGFGKIAINTRGVYSYLTQDLEKMKDAISQYLGRLMSVTATDIRINLRTLNHAVTISSIFCGHYEQAISRKRNYGAIKVPHLYAGEQKNFIVCLDVPNGPQNHLMTVSGSYTKPSGPRWSNKIQLDDSELVVVRPKVATTPPDETVCPDVAAEITRLRLMDFVCSVLSKENALKELQWSWEKIKGLRDGFKSPQSVVLALDKDVDAMQRTNGNMFITSWLTSHVLQRPSSSFGVKAMEEMIKKADAEQKPSPESTSGDDEVPGSGMADDAESRGDVFRKLVHFDGPLAFTGHDLCCAPVEQIEVKMYALKYVVTLADGSPVVVKRLWGITEDNNKFEAEATVLGKIRHPNIEALRAYYLKLESKDEKLLIYDYMPNAMLLADNIIQSGDPNKRLEWPTLMKIAKGTARGLAYLHDDMSIIHGNLTAYDVLLDEQYNPKIKDFGLFRRMTAAANCSMLSDAYGRSHCAPELSKMEEANEKTDVYSLGVLILILLLQVGSTYGMGYVSPAELLQYARYVITKGRLSEKGKAHLHDRLIQRNMDTIMLALQCVDPSPSVRPEAREVLQRLEQTSLGSDGGVRQSEEEGHVPLPAGEEDYSAESGDDVAGKVVHFDEQLAFTADVVVTSVIIGKSTYGTVYKVTLEDGSLVAVKLLRQMIAKGDKMFEAESAVLGKIQHPNLLALRAYNLEPKLEEEKVLIFDYMPKGNLVAFLHGRGRSTRMEWPTVMKIAKGTARGLAYLHDDASIIHGNLTAWNVLLDEQCDPKIADFGLFRLMTAEANCSMLSALYVRGYRAPELSKVEEANAKTDVYSLGVIILALLTHKSPTYRIDGMDLPQWVASSIVKKRRSKLFSKGLRRDAAAGNFIDELMDTLKLALQCVDPSPSARPEAREVLRRLEQVSKLVNLDVPLACTANDLLYAAREIIGQNCHGTLYNVSLKDGSELAIKLLMRENIKDHNEFQAEAVVLGKIRHPNLMSIRAYYMGPDGSRMLVLDQMPKRNLSVLLHDRGSDNTSMCWFSRITIAKRTARGLAYLHDDMSIICGNLTASNVLLDEHYLNLKIAGFELSRLMTAEANSNMLAAVGAQGYRAPELSKLEEANAKTDVYSLGVIILELMTGKSAQNRIDGMDLPQWVASNVKKEWTSLVFYPELRSDAMEEELTDTLKLALQCVDPSPSVRPEAREVLRQLEQIRKLVHFDQPLACTTDDLLSAPRKIMCYYSSGIVYNVLLKDGSRMTFRCMRSDSIKGHIDFEAEAAVLAKIRHHNLMALRAYFKGPRGSKMLVLDDMTVGSLYDALDSPVLDMRVGWLIRMKIMKGMARGLAYLHDGASIICGNLTASNVLLDELWNPKIAYFGLSRLMTDATNFNELAATSAMGYRAPELSKLEEANVKTDVYSLGIIILALLTGKFPTYRMDGMDLPQWVASMVKKERTSEVFDLGLVGSAVDKELTDTLKLALQCVDPSPSVRPEAREVLRRLEQIRPGSDAGTVPLSARGDDRVALAG